MIKNLFRCGVYAALISGAAAVAGCASGGGNAVLTPPPTPTPKPALAYTAIGASDAVGYGASKPCTTALPPDGPADPTCLGITGTGYVPVLARRFQSTSTVTLDDLGYSGAVLAPDLLHTINSYGSAADCSVPQNYPTDFVTYELPRVSPSATLVTIFAGGNDTIGLINAVGCGAGGATLGEQVTFLQTQITVFRNDLATLIAGVKRAAPNAKIAIANLPNLSLIPLGKAQSAAARQGLAFLSTQLDAQAINPLATSGIVVVDLLCDPKSYVATNFYTDGFHPNDSGYAAFAQAFYPQITAATPAPPATTCGFATQQGTLRSRLAGGLRHI